ncbi:MAG TPA: hydrogenase iron-sulfur subunit [Bacteroidales bacterium]|nr:hydrogenase iron-sulfur subunit [Bacteroidales bacterium]
MASNKPRILVFSTEKISDPAIDLAGLLKIHYPSSVYMITLPCSSGIKPRWILHAFDKGFDGVFIAADGSDCPFSSHCERLTGDIVAGTHEIMKARGMDPARLKMAAICSVCAEAFARHMKNFNDHLSENQKNQAIPS